MFTALAIGHYLYAITGWPKRRLFATLGAIIDTTLAIAGHTISATDPNNGNTTYIGDKITPPR